MGVYLTGVHLMGVYLITLFRGCTATEISPVLAYKRVA
jgi:hypothetical protein